MNERAPDTLTRSDAWTRQAACRRWDPDLFHSDRAADQMAAQAVCKTCPVREACLADAMAWEGRRGRRWGIFGGMTRGERDALAAQAGGAPGRPPAPCGTETAYNRHVRRGEPIDEPCRRAHREEAARYYAATKAVV